MKKPLSVFIVTMIALHSLSFGMEQGCLAEKMSLFESTQVIHKFLSGKTKNNYTGKYLTRVSLEFCESHPKKGFAYVYFFNNRGGRLGGELTIHHFIDGEIFEHVGWGHEQNNAQRADGPNRYAFGTSGISPTEQAQMPKASGRK